MLFAFKIKEEVAMEPITDPEMRKRMAENKKIPPQFLEPVLAVLPLYPELQNTRIIFKSVNKQSVPYSTRPTARSVFRKPAQRTYCITLLDRGEGPLWQALFRNLSFDSQVAVIAHELGHVVQFSRCSRQGLLKMILLYVLGPYKRKIERGADTEAIRHGLGKELYSHALYIRSIPGYLKQRPELNKLYLLPPEILERVRSRLAG